MNQLIQSPKNIILNPQSIFEYRTMKSKRKLQNNFSIFLSCLFAFAFISFVLPGEGHSKTMYVKKSGTKLRSADSTKSKVLGKLGKGTALDVTEKSGKFLKVSTPDGQSGWIFKFKLTAKKPAGSGGGGDFLGALGGQQIAARESSSGSSIRGLSPMSEKHAKNKGISQSNIDDVKKMEQFKVSDQELQNFLSQGKLGEYGS